MPLRNKFLILCLKCTEVFIFGCDYFCLQFESVDVYNLILYGSGAFLGLWLVSAIVGAIDSIPVVSSSYINLC